MTAVFFLFYAVVCRSLVESANFDTFSEILPTSKNEKFVQLDSFWITALANSMHLQTKMNSEMCQKVPSLDLRSAVIKNYGKNFHIFYNFMI